MKRIPHQLVPLGILFILGIAALIAARQVLVPKTFGEYGHYRAAAVDEIANLPESYAGITVCADCHDDKVEELHGGRHRTLSCEVCHGAALAHAEDPGEMMPTIPRGRDFCPVCHGYNPARPSGFPQIVTSLHNPGKPCMECHYPHQPVTPTTPSECSACHREIVNQKSVSHHVNLKCTTCHEVPKRHFDEPRAVLAKKPTSNTLCGGCHARGADSPIGIPRIDVESHAGRYKCWDCHYPHFPEGRI